MNKKEKRKKYLLWLVKNPLLYVLIIINFYFFGETYSMIEGTIGSLIAIVIFSIIELTALKNLQTIMFKYIQKLEGSRKDGRYIWL
jgi:hypothetical protein